MTGQVWFTPVRAHNTLEVFVRALHDGAWMDLPVEPPHHDACNDLHRGGAQVSCPTVPNSEHLWNLDFDVPALPIPLVNKIVECTLLKYFIFETKKYFFGSYGR